jgi:hypothetical protein
MDFYRPDYAYAHSSLLALYRTAPSEKATLTDGPFPYLLAGTRLEEKACRHLHRSIRLRPRDLAEPR